MSDTAHSSIAADEAAGTEYDIIKQSNQVMSVSNKFAHPMAVDSLKILSSKSNYIATTSIDKSPNLQCSVIKLSLSSLHKLSY
jgi:hypothetical protein